jgi:predicted Zn-dependent peptidase
MLKPVSLKNGMSVLRFPKSCNTFIIGFVVKTGSAVEDNNFPQGISYLVEKLFWRGTYKHPSTKHLNNTLESLGGSFTSFTTQESTHFYLEVPVYNQYKAISFLSEVIQRSYFDSRDIENEKRLIIDQLKDLNQSMEYEINESSISNIYSNSSLGLPVYGFIDTINMIGQAEVMDYLAHQYCPNLCSIVFAGNFESKKTLELLEQEWSVWNPKSRKPLEILPFNRLDAGEFPRVSYRQRGVAQTFMSIDFILDEGYKPKEEISKTIKVDEADKDIKTILKSEKEEKLEIDERLQNFANLMVLNAILGQGYSSRLYSKGIEEEMLFNTVESKLNYFTNTSYFQITGCTDNLQFSFGLECILSALDSLRKTTVSINELAKAKNFLKGKLIRDHENLLLNTIWGVDNYNGSGMIYDIEKIIEKIDKVESPVIRSTALDLFIPERMSITTLGTAKESKLVEKLIKKYLS